MQPQRSTRLEPESAAPPPVPGWAHFESTPSGSERRTRLEGEAGQEPVPPPLTPRPTRLEEPPVGRRTVFQEGSLAVPAPSPMTAAPPPEVVRPAGLQQVAGTTSSRRLLGVLAAPDLGPGGTVFPVRGGRNTIGSDRRNDVILTADPQVSGEHAVILHRNGVFHLTDRLSTNGTLLNGEEIPANGTVPLRDRDRIRCGHTDLIFLAIEPGSSEATGMS